MSSDLNNIDHQGLSQFALAVARYHTTCDCCGAVAQHLLGGYARDADGNATVWAAACEQCAAAGAATAMRSVAIPEVLIPAAALVGELRFDGERFHPVDEP